jgi:tetratricopeptide (TPR) repeat protein
VALPYLPALSNGFVWLDHAEIEEGAVLVHGIDDLGRHLVPSADSPYFRPVYDLTHSLDRWWWGLAPFGFHLSSLMVHLVNVLLVFCVAQQVGAGPVAAGSLAVLWGLHPVNSAVVGLIHAKADLLVAAMLLASVHVFLRGWTAAALVFYGFALLSKETALVLPLAVAPLPISSERPVRGYAIGVTAMASLVLILRVLYPGPPTHIGALGLLERLATFASVYLDYLLVILFHLRLFIGDTVTRFTALEAQAQIGVLAGALTCFAAFAAVAVRSRRLRFWVLLFHILLLPVSQIVPILHFRADRFLYLPSLAFLALVVAWARTIPIERPKLAILFPASVAFLYAAIVMVRLRDFRDDESLFTRETATTPDYREGLGALARFYDSKGKADRAEELYRRALAETAGRISYLDQAGVVVNLTANLLAQGKNEDSYRVAVENRDRFASEKDALDLSYNQAVAAHRLGRYREALELLQAYGAQRPDDAGCLYLTGVVAYRLQEFSLARDAFQEYLRISPDAVDRAEVERFLASMPSIP